MAKKSGKCKNKRKKSLDRLPTSSSSRDVLTANKPRSSQSIGLARRHNSVTSIASQYNQSCGRFTGRITPNESLKQVKEALMVDSYGQSLYDCVLVYLQCPKHKKVALTSVDKGQFLPFGPIYNGESWLTSVATLINHILDLGNKVNESRTFTEPTVVDILRVQVPIYFQFITRVTYYSELSTYACHTGQCCKDNPIVAWFDISSVRLKNNSNEQYLGPEPVIFNELAVPNHAKCREITVLDALVYEVGTGQRTPQGQLLNFCGYTEEDVLRLYGDFILHCYPSEFMTYYTFETYLKRADLKLCNKARQLEAIFRSFNFNQTNGYINFNEFILGLAMIDKLNGYRANDFNEVKESNGQDKSDTKTKSKKVSKSKSVSKSASMVKTKSGNKIHNKGTANFTSQLNEITAGYIFRYFAKSTNVNSSSKHNQLSEEDFNNALTSLSLSEGEILKLKQLGSKNKSPLSEKDFISIVASRLSPNTCSSIYSACTISMLDHFTLKTAYPPINFRQIKKRQDCINAIQAKLSRARELCSNCRSKRYTAASYLVKVSSNGIICDPTSNRQPDVERMSKAKRALSEHYFMPNYVCNQMADMIRKFASKLQMYQLKGNFEALDWVKERNACLGKIEKVCEDARQLFERESRVVKITSPCYVIGDIHGNLRDLLIYEQIIWRQGPYFCTANCLLLGDYVDRGDWSIECILYLLSMKLLAPERLFMLRGNHESRALQREFTFFNECIDKFGSVDGNRIFELFNKTFDYMPVCAIIDEQVL